MIPIQVASSRQQFVELSKIPVLGSFGLFGISLLPAVGSMALAPVVSAVLGRPFTEDQGLAMGLLLSVPWNLSLAAFDLRFKILFAPAWAFCAVLGLFGVAKVYFRL